MAKTGLEHCALLCGMDILIMVAAPTTVALSWALSQEGRVVHSLEHSSMIARDGTAWAAL
jgi:hypothetical protein